MLGCVERERDLKEEIQKIPYIYVRRRRKKKDLREKWRMSEETKNQARIYIDFVSTLIRHIGCDELAAR